MKNNNRMIFMIWSRRNKGWEMMSHLKTLSEWKQMAKKKVKISGKMAKEGYKKVGDLQALE